MRNNPVYYADPSGEFILPALTMTAAGAAIYHTFRNSSIAEKISGQKKTATAASAVGNAVRTAGNRIQTVSKSSAAIKSLKSLTATKNTASGITLPSKLPEAWKVPKASSKTDVVSSAQQNLENLQEACNAAKNKPVEPKKKKILQYTLKDGMKWIGDHAKPVVNYFSNSAAQMIQGNYYTGKPTVLGTAGQVALGTTGLDGLADARDIIYDINHWGEQEHPWINLAIDAAALIPGVGAFKYADEVKDAVKPGVKNLDSIIESVNEEIPLIHTTKYISGVVNDHHIIPKFRGKSKHYADFIAARGIDVDQYTITVSGGKSGLHMNDIHGKGEWNKKWIEFIDNNPNATDKDIFQFAGKMLDEYGLSNYKIHPYGKGDTK